ncbi:MAG: cupin domain-containing protein [Pirellulaceae bacterium]|nr:cupin domain-containing protein [Pirellulaceae bacterium]
MANQEVPAFGHCLSAQPWQQLADGLREKSCDVGPQRFRIVEFSEPFEEPEWCYRGHAGYVLSGQMIVNVDGVMTTYRAGDVISLPRGVRHRHHTTIETTQLFLVEDPE